ncbi:MAG: FAD/FMN-containing dehydrogenase [Candidatus Azotimanducaceae bacterium]|jgi:FAD/FMN-containing dehydrogenase
MNGSSSRSLTVVNADSKKKSVQKARKASVSHVKKPAKKSVAKPKVATKTKPKTARAKKAVATKNKVKVVTKKTKATPKKAAKKASDSFTFSPLNTQKTIGGLKREPLGHLLIEQKLVEAGFRGGVSSDKLILDAYSTDESIFSIRPQIVLRPRNKQDVEIAASVIAKETKQFPSLSLTPRAAGTGLSGGSLTDSIVIDVSAHMHGMDEPITKKGETSVTCEPGALWSSVEKKLAEHNVYLPSAPASKDICSIGGSVANNAAGPDSLKYGHTADWVQSMTVVLHDGKTYTIEPLSYKQYKKLTQGKDAYAEIARRVFHLLEKNEKTINAAEPKTQKNTAGYALWDVLSCTVSQFKDGKGTFDLTRLISGSQGTIGILTSITLKTIPITEDTTLIVLPIFDLDCAGKAILQALKYDPVNIEIFDGLSFDLALKNPEFFKERMRGLSYYKVMLSLYTTYHVRYRRTIPEFTILITLTDEEVRKQSRREIAVALQSSGCNIVRFIKSREEREMWWQVRRSSYTLSKMQDSTKRPAAFLEDMTVPPQNLFGFFADIKKLFKKYDIKAAMHGHGGNGHFHFYPLLDFSSKETPALIEKMSEEFFATAIKYDGSICGEHNDGIIRTPHLNKMFDKKTRDLFKEVENIFDPQDIFNPGKKVNPRFDIKDSLRKTN